MIYENGNYYGARHYAPCIMRFTTMDPMCEKYYHLSPYAYCGNNPVKYVDPNGKSFLYMELLLTNNNYPSPICISFRIITIGFFCNLVLKRQ